MNFYELVRHKKLNSCSVCDTHEYQLPFPLTKEIEGFLAQFGPLRYPLDKVALVRIDNDFLSFQGRVGRTFLKVKFKQKGDFQRMFEMQLANYITATMMPGLELTF